MKQLGIFLIVICIAVVGGMIYMNTISVVEPFSVSCAVSRLSENATVRELLLEQLENGTFTGTRYSSETISSPDDYLVYTWKVRVENRTALPAKGVSIQVTPERYDILQFDMDSLRTGKPAEHWINPGTFAEFEIGIVVYRQDNPASVESAKTHNASVTWYLGGFAFPGANGNHGKLVLKP